jgi:hypothetical protein
VSLKQLRGGAVSQVIRRTALLLVLVIVALVLDLVAFLAAAIWVWITT